MHRKSNGGANGSKTLYTTHNAEPRMHGNIIARNYFENWRRQKRLSDLKHAKSPSDPRFSLEINWKSRFARGILAAKSFSERPFAITYESTIRPGNLFYNIIFLVLARIPFKIWKISSFFSMSSCSSCLCSFIFTGPARICDVTMSRTWIYSWCEITAVFFNFLIYFCSFRSFRLFR